MLSVSFAFYFLFSKQSRAELGSIKQTVRSVQYTFLGSQAFDLCFMRMLSSVDIPTSTDLQQSKKVKESFHRMA